MSIKEPIRLFLEPRSVALVGVPRRTGQGAFNILETLLYMGFRGSLYLVNPQAQEILGYPCYPQAISLPSGIDLAVILLPRHLVLEAVRGCLERGIRAFIIVSDGFAEADEEGAALQRELVNMARAAGARVVGPNTVGVVNKFGHFCTSFMPPHPAAAPVAVVSQSGGVLESIPRLTMGKGIDLGNMADVDFADVLEYLEGDSEIRVIVLHMEGIGSARRFLQLASRVGRQKPIILLKTGRGELASRAAASHTGSLAGRFEIASSAFQRAGLFLAEDMEEVGDLALAFLNLPLPKGKGVGVITPTGGLAVMALEALERHGLELAQLSPGTVERLKPYLPHPWTSLRNPVDIMSAALTFGYKQVYQTTLEAMLQDEEVSAILCFAGAPTLKTISRLVRGASKPVVTCAQGDWGVEFLSQFSGLDYKAIYPSPERAIRALAALWRWAATQGEPGKGPAPDTI